MNVLFCKKSPLNQEGISAKANPASSCTAVKHILMCSRIYVRCNEVEITPEIFLGGGRCSLRKWEGL